MKEFILKNVMKFPWTIFWRRRCAKWKHLVRIIGSITMAERCTDCWLQLACWETVGILNTKCDAITTRIEFV